MGYIDRDSLLKKIERYGLGDGGTLGSHSGAAEELIEQVELFPVSDVVPRKEYNRVCKALAHMWFAYVNKDGEFPHEYELQAVEMAEKLLGKWEDCMPELLREEENE